MRAPPRAHDVCARVFRPRRSGGQRAFVATLGDVVDARGAVLDEALCTRFPDGRSYAEHTAMEVVAAMDHFRLSVAMPPDRA